jgi:ubiquinone/menaquinone biosynthesis C-methylase UbiE
MHGKNLDGNADAIEAWNTVLFDKFVLYRDILAAGLGIHGETAMDRAALHVGARVLDVGCGFGDTTQVLARRVGPTGEATGVDAAERFIAGAQSEANAAGIANAKFKVVDVQSGDLGGPYDVAYSRMGTMFFASPVAALRNVRKSLVSGGRLAMAVWRRKDDNPFLSVVESRVLELVTVPEETDQVTCGPGPFSMASTDVVSAQLLAAGFERPTFERFDGEIFIGKDLQAAIEFSLALGPAGEIMRLAGEAAEKRRPEIIAAIEDVIQPFVRPNGVWAMSSSWIVTARAP